MIFCPQFNACCTEITNIYPITNDEHMTSSKKVAKADAYLSRVKKVEENLKKTQNEVSLIHRDVMEIKSLLDQLKGGWRGLMMIIGGASLIGALIANILAIFKGW